MTMAIWEQKKKKKERIHSCIHKYIYLYIQLCIYWLFFSSFLRLSLFLVCTFSHSSYRQLNTLYMYIYTHCTQQYNNKRRRSLKKAIAKKRNKGVKHQGGLRHGTNTSENEAHHRRTTKKAKDNTKAKWEKYMAERRIKRETLCLLRLRGALFLCDFFPKTYNVHCRY